ncbi:hypothetical protein E4J71_21540 [Peribacillus frigoritolerans]|nr:hypothetical protein E4J71_21540 [Peribacillus frigoritolerans]
MLSFKKGEGARLLLRKVRLGEKATQAQAEEAPRPPAESECLERKSTPKLYSQKKAEALCLSFSL